MSVDFDIIVIGGGHAGAEAAHATARLGLATLLVTLDPKQIAAMSCNPAIGGIGKGQIVREIDAMGGLMALAADATGIQFRMLNRSKGPAVWGPRCQSDRHAYAEWIQAALIATPNLTIMPGEVTDIHVADGAVTGVSVVPNMGDSAFDIRGSTFDIPEASGAQKTLRSADPMPEPFRRNPSCQVCFAKADKNLS